jgi:NADH-quinone oxidoreductase subunit G
VRQALGHAGEVRPGWQVLADLCERLDVGTGALTAPMVTALVAEAVPFYSGLTLEEIGGLGVRWQDRGAASSLPVARPSDEALAEPPRASGELQLTGAATLWTGGGVRHSPSLRFLDANARAELSVEDAGELGVASGDEIELTVRGESVVAIAAIRTGVPRGSVFLAPALLPDGPVELAPARQPAEVG